MKLNSQDAKEIGDDLDRLLKKYSLLLLMYAPEYLLLPIAIGMAGSVESLIKT